MVLDTWLQGAVNSMDKLINDIISQPLLINSVEIIVSTLLIFLLVHFTKVASTTLQITEFPPLYLHKDKIE